MRAEGREAFIHDADARNDDRILELRLKFGAAGYGIYWMLIETMRTAEHYRLARSRTSALAFGFGVTRDELEQVIQSGVAVGLFVEEGDFFSSPSLLRRMEKYESRCAVNRSNRLRGTNERRTFDERKRTSNDANTNTNTNTIQTLIPTLEVNSEDQELDPIPQTKPARAQADERIEFAPLVRMTAREHATLLAEFGRESVDYHVRAVSDYLKASGKTKKDYAAFIRNWIRKAIAERSEFYSPRRNGTARQTTLDVQEHNRMMLAKVRAEEENQPL